MIKTRTLKFKKTRILKFNCPRSRLENVSKCPGFKIEMPKTLKVKDHIFKYLNDQD